MERCHLSWNGVPVVVNVALRCVGGTISYGIDKFARDITYSPWERMIYCNATGYIGHKNMLGVVAEYCINAVKRRYGT